MNIDRSATLTQRLQGDMQRILGIRRRARTRGAATAETEAHIWVAGQAGVQRMTREQFARWR